MSKAGYAVTFGVAAFGCGVTVMVAKAQMQPDAWYGWIVKSPWLLRVSFATTLLCFLFALSRTHQFRRWAWAGFGWLVPEPSETVTAREEASGRINALTGELGIGKSTVQEQSLQITDLKAELAAAQAELGPVHEARAEAQRKAELLKSAPEIIVRYETDGTTEKLRITNTGKEPVENFQFTSLVTQDRYEVETSPGAPAALLAGESGWCEVFFKYPGTGCAVPLVDILTRKTPGESDLVTLNCKGAGDAAWFSKDFNITRNVDDSLTWTPGPVRVRPAT